MKKASNEELQRMDELLGRAIETMRDCGKDFAAYCRNCANRVSTGIHDLDIALSGGLANELYVLGAETSTGKSAIMISIAQNIAASGIDVLYFALEMGRNEFFARGISEISYRHTLENKYDRPFTSGDILYWQYDRTKDDFVRVPFSAYEQYFEEYLDKYGDHLHVIEAGTAGLTVTDVANCAALYKEKTQRTPVVIVDYIQLLRPKKGDYAEADRKTKTDVIVTTLKSLASQTGIPVLAISSLSRSGYGASVSNASFKESGDIEYTAGVLLGWNWHGVTDAKPDEARAEKLKCAERRYRVMTIELLKFRNGVDGIVKLKYYPAYNYITAYTQEDEENEKKELAAKQAVIFK